MKRHLSWGASQKKVEMIEVNWKIEFGHEPRERIQHLAGRMVLSWKNLAASQAVRLGLCIGLGNGSSNPAMSREIYGLMWSGRLKLYSLNRHAPSLKLEVHTLYSELRYIKDEVVTADTDKHMRLRRGNLMTQVVLSTISTLNRATIFSMLLPASGDKRR